MAQKLIRRFKCPSCASENTLRISKPRNTKEKLLQVLIFIKIYRCRTCGWRGWKINFSINEKAIKNIVIYIFLFLIAAFIVYNLLKMVV